MNQQKIEPRKNSLNDAIFLVQILNRVKNEMEPGERNKIRKEEKF